MQPTRRKLLWSAFLVPCSLAFATLARAQQFVEQVNLIPGALQWTEACVTVDADADGRPDVLLVRANGWQVPGDLQATSTTPLTPILLRNTNTVNGNPVFVDESATYLPAGLAMHGKSAAVGDFNSDGADDLAFSAVFGSAQRLLLKQSLLGPWNDASANLPALNANSFSVQAADVDADGDLDLVYSDSGPQSFSPPGGKAHLLINDGAAHFTEQPTWLNAANKIAAQNVRFVDIDNDFDLDFTIDGKSAQTQLYVNDGTSHFALDLTTVPAGVGGAFIGCYETDYADLDGDGDMDVVLMSFPGNGNFTDGVGKNLLAETGSLSFTASTTYLAGANGDDDNDWAFVDADDDGDLDVVLATLGASHEKLYRNDHPGTPQWSLTFTPGAGFSTIKDSTLDIVFADFDLDGDFDAVTVQGETGNFKSRYYKNTGPSDTHAPSIERVQSTGSTVPFSALQTNKYFRRAFIQDAITDDGQNDVKAKIAYTFDDGAALTSLVMPAPHVGGGLFQGALALPSAAPQFVGSKIAWHFEATDPNGNVSASPTETFTICGYEPYGPTSAVNSISILGLANPVIGQPGSIRFVGGPPLAQGLVFVGAKAAAIPAFGGTFLVDVQAPFITAPLALDAQGNVTLSGAIPNDPAIVSTVIVVQGAVADPSAPAGVRLSRGLRIGFCGS